MYMHHVLVSVCLNVSQMHDMTLESSRLYRCIARKKETRRNKTSLCSKVEKNGSALERSETRRKVWECCSMLHVDA